MNNRLKLKYFLLFLFFNSVLLIYFLCRWNLWGSNVYSKNFPTTFDQHGFNHNSPIILLWTNYFSLSLKNTVFFDTENCPYKCHVTTNRALSDKADVRVYHIRDFNYSDRPIDDEKSLNVYFSLESPISTYFSGSPYPPSSYFNITSTYRSNSDVYFPYDAFVELNGTETEDEKYSKRQVEEAIEKKAKPIFVAISNCDDTNGRLAYLEELQKHINLTFVGHCNNVACDDDCMNKGLDEHHFYLAFENSVCPEYLTEKFWRIKKLIVPIVLSRGVVPKSIPHNSFIAASDFESPKKLADYLMEIIEDKEKYRSFFSWTKKYRRTVIKPKGFVASCHLCKLAFDARSGSIFPPKNYESEWSKSECIKDYGKRLIDEYSELKIEEQKMKELVEKTSRKRVVGRID